MASILGDGTGPGGPGTSRCLLLLQRSLAIQLTRGPPPHIANASQRESPKEHPADEMWMYDKGYNLFQVSHVIFVLFISLFILSIFFYRVAMRVWAFFQFSSINGTRVWHFRGELLFAPEIIGAGKVLRKRTSERKKKTRRVSASRLRVFLRVFCFVPSSCVDARVLYGKADVDCPHRYTTMRQCELRAISQK